MKGRLIGVVPIDRTNTIVTLKLEKSPADIEKLNNKELSVELKEYKKRRSLDANAMYWSLLTQLAGKLHMSNAEMHNKMLTDYGQTEIIDGHIVYISLEATDEALKQISRSEQYHLRHVNGTNEFALLRGSHTYNTAEFSQLLNGLVAECREVGIQTESDDEIAHIMSLYKGAK